MEDGAHIDTAGAAPLASPLRTSNLRIDSDDDLLLLQLVMGAQPTLLIVAAAEAKVFDRLGDARLSAADIAQLASLDPRATRLVLDALVGLGLLVKNGPLYENTPTAKRHLRVEGSNSSAVRLWIAGTRQWERLPSILKTGKVPAADDGAETWLNHGSGNPAFVRAMLDLGWMTAQSVVEAIDLTGVSHLVDLGAGPGRHAIAMLERYPSLRATLVDLPLALMVAGDAIRRRRLDDRVDLRACDLYAPDADIPVQPGSANVVLISHVLHLESAQQNQRLIGQAAALLAPGGRLLIHDMFLEDDGTHPQMSSMFAVHMLATTPRGEVYPTTVIGGWLEQAGLEARVLSTSPFLIEGARAG